MREGGHLSLAIWILFDLTRCVRRLTGSVILTNDTMSVLRFGAYLRLHSEETYGLPLVLEILQ